MANNSKKSRRSFLKKAVSTAFITGAVPKIILGKPKGKIVELQPSLPPPKKYSPNDHVNIAVIGMGIMGFSNARTSSQIPGVKLVGACDLYTGHLDRAREVFGNDLFTSKDYREILDRKEVDAVIIATSDHWHDRISIEAMNKGKHVYCEKPMVHKLEEGAAVIETQKKTGKVFQVGSQRVSSITTLKAQELFESGMIGELMVAETWMDRSSSNGAWQYSIPTDAKDGTVDWEKFLGDAPKMPYDPVRFFRWRNYQDYGTGMAGDLFVHLFSELHTITSSKGPNRIYATGGLRFWKDGRDVPDVMMSLFDYPASPKHSAFNLQMRVNFVDGSDAGQRLKLIGTDGVIIMGGGAVKVERHKVSRSPSFGGWDTFDTFSESQQKEYEKWFTSTYPKPKFEMEEPDTEYKTPRGYNSDHDHHLNFYSGIREKTPIKEDAWFSMRAAGPALAANKSYFEKKTIHWDPEMGKVV